VSTAPAAGAAGGYAVAAASVTAVLAACAQRAYGQRDRHGDVPAGDVAEGREEDVPQRDEQ
jgi:hypothetical protein